MQTRNREYMRDTAQAETFHCAVLDKLSIARKHTVRYRSRFLVKVVEKPVLDNIPYFPEQRETFFCFNARVYRTAVLDAVRQIVIWFAVIKYSVFIYLCSKIYFISRFAVIAVQFAEVCYHFTFYGHTADADVFKYQVFAALVFPFIAYGCAYVAGSIFVKLAFRKAVKL